MMLVVCGVAINYTNADYIEHCLTDSQFRATHGHIHVGESIWADESQCEAEYKHTHLQYFPSIVAVASYVCHILGHSVCLPSTNNQILHPSRHSLINWISDTLSQGYTSLQSLVKCLGHRNIVSDTVCSQVQVVLGCAMHLNASRGSLLMTFSAVSDSFDNSLQSSIGPFVQSIDMPSTAATFQGFTQMLFKI